MSRILETPLRFLIAPLAYAFDVVVGIRNALYDTGFLAVRHLDRPVISIGNLSFGGTGKTPMTALIARFLRDSGLRVCVLSRGYGRKTRGRIIVSDFESILVGPEAAGDEPFLIASECPGVMVVVDSDRVSAGMALQARCDCFILDDGFQYRSLHRHADLVLVDASKSLPRFGPAVLSGFRERLRALRRAQAVILTHFDKCRADRLPDVLAPYLRPRAAIYRSRHSVTRLRDLLTGTELPIDLLRGRPAVVFSGIANPASFEVVIEDSGAEIVEKLRFPDHHRYGAGEIDAIISRHPGLNFVTTEKDAVKMASIDLAAGGNKFYSTVLTLEIDGEESLRTWIAAQIENFKPARK